MMDGTWLQYVVDGGALVLLAVVLFGLWKMAQQFVAIMKQMVDQVQAGIKVQEQLQASVVRACQLVTEHEVRTLGRLAEVENRILEKQDDRERAAQERHREVLRRLPSREKGS